MPVSLLLFRSICRLPLAAIIVGSLHGCTDDDGDLSSSDTVILWQVCSDDVSLECATLSVPLVHDAPDGRFFSIDLVRLPATGSDEVESLLVNPGGPGGTGTELVRSFSRFDAVPDAVRARFDLIGFDPRGVGVSDRIDCERYGLDELDAYPLDRDDLQILVDDTRRIVDRCFSEYGDRLLWLGSNSVVKDMDLIRAALGAEKLNFIGYSYGTRLAALYLQQFPERSGRLILDGSVLPAGDVAPLVAGQATALQRNLERLFDACGTTLPECRRSDLELALPTRVRSIIESGDDLAFELFGELIVTAVENPDFGDLAAPVLIDYIFAGDRQPLVEFAEMLESLDDRPEPLVDDSETILRAVICNDDPTRPTLDSLVTTLSDLDTASDLFGENLTTLAALCVGWPEAVDPIAPVMTSDAPASLVIGGTSDAQTPIEWAPLMADAIGGVFLRSDHAGHTAVFSDSSVCVDAVALAFLLDGTLPVDRECEGESSMAGL